jgi:hypothetical protein
MTRLFNHHDLSFSLQMVNFHKVKRLVHFAPFASYT